MKIGKKYFNPNWSDLKLDLKVADIPLYLPEEIKKKENSNIWIKRKTVLEELFGKELIKLEKPRSIVSILRKSSAGKNMNLEITNLKGEKIETEDSFYDFIFPPRVWMSNNLQEKVMMYNAAKLAKGKILVGGLGLGIYPQLVLFLNRPVSSITIVENNSEIINLVGNPLLKILEDVNVEIKIIENSIENYMSLSDKHYDTIYLDTWGDVHFKFLPYINYLILLAEEIIEENGIIQCWGYNHMYEDFLNFVQELENKQEIWGSLNTDDNLILKEYFFWRKKLSGKPTKKEIIKKAKEIAVNINDKNAMELSIDLPASKWLRQSII